MSYAKFAKTYDKLMDKSLYPQWANFVQHCAENRVSLLELACGTGDLAVLLKECYEVVASDLSSDMLAIAQSKIGDMPLLEVNMCDLTDLPSFDVITCFADSLCYLKNPAQVQQALQQAYQTLNPNGVYLFDVHSTYQMTVVFNDYHYQYVDEDTVFTWQSFEGEHSYSVEHELTCCQRLKGNLYDRYDECHYQRTYPLEQWLKWLSEVGFSNIKVSADFGQNEVNEQTTRWFFVCYK